MEERVQRRRSKVEVYLHFVWTVKRRAACLTPSYDTAIYRCIIHKTQEMGCIVLAIGGVPDHIHLLVRFGSKESISSFVRICKAASSALYNQMSPENSEIFHGQDGYGCFSLHPNHIDRVQNYINEQKERHAENRLWNEWEQFDELAPFSRPTGGWSTPHRRAKTRVTLSQTKNPVSSTRDFCFKLVSSLLGLAICLAYH